MKTDKNKMDELGTLIKFGQHAHLLRLRDEGLLYLNPLRYFWEIEDEELRGDSFDCIAQVARGHKVIMRFSNGKEVVSTGWIFR